MPSGVFGSCDYMVTWETAAACPMRSASPASAAFWLLLALLAYLAVGFACNVRAAGSWHAAGGWSALPHLSALQALGSALQTAAAATGMGVWQALERCTPYVERAWGAVMARMGHSSYSEF